MKATFTLRDNSPGLTDTPGFRAAGVACDIREKGDPRRDLAMVVSTLPCSCAGVFTTHDLPAAPVRVCREILARGHAVHGFVANSGNANACTGAGGMDHAWEMVRLASNAAEVPQDTMLVCSTGRIGRAMPMSKVTQGIQLSTTKLGTDANNGTDAAWAILTSDTRPKTATVTFVVDGKTVTVAGMAKGAGMIQPNMATMLAFVTTDVAVSADVLKGILKKAVEPTFNALTVDGDMSTNDTVLVFANGASGVNVTQGTAVYDNFTTALTMVCENLAKKIVKDGEKVTKCIELTVKGARTTTDAERVARAVANSLLVKSSWFGNDPNWGRLADAAGYVGANIIEERLDIFYNTTSALIGGVAQDKLIPEWKAIVSQAEFSITLNLNLGESQFRLLTTDLTEGYVNYNKSE